MSVSNSAGSEVARCEVRGREVARYEVRGREVRGVKDPKYRLMTLFWTKLYEVTARWRGARCKVLFYSHI